MNDRLRPAVLGGEDARDLLSSVVLNTGSNDGTDEAMPPPGRSPDVAREADGHNSPMMKSSGTLSFDERWFATALSSIGDAVIATDHRGRVIFLNPVAEALTGWPDAEAHGKDLAEIFPIVNELTRMPVESPVESVLATGQTVGLANHTVLIGRDRRECPV